MRIISIIAVANIILLSGITRWLCFNVSSNLEFSTDINGLHAANTMNGPILRPTDTHTHVRIVLTFPTIEVVVCVCYLFSGLMNGDLS